MSYTLCSFAAIDLICSDLDGVKWLLSRGAQVDMRDRQALTPLHYAVGLGRVAIATVLLQKGANPNAQVSR